MSEQQVVPAAPGYFVKWGSNPSSTARVIAWLWDGTELFPLIDHGGGHLPGPVSRELFVESEAKIVYRVPTSGW